MESGMILLDAWDLALGAALVVALALASLPARLGVARPLLMAAVRTILQLLLVGYVLDILFDIDSPWLVALWAFVMLAVAGREVVARQSRRYRSGRGYGIGLGSMFVSSFAVTILAVTVVISVDPWWEPRYAIPLLGMILGNTMTGVAVALDRLTVSAWEHRSLIEQRLMLGQPYAMATSGLRRHAMRAGMIPIMNSMAAAGLISLPGMMTGQILAGIAPIEAVKYQIVVMFLIAAGTGFGTMLAVRWGTDALFDDRERLRLDRLVERG